VRSSSLLDVGIIWRNPRNQVINMTDELNQTRARIAELGRLMFDRFLTDTAGGNISVRVGDLVCITPRFAGSRFQWRLKPEQVLVTDLDGKMLEGDGEPSREGKAHYRLLKEFTDAKSLVHGHARHAAVFCAAAMPMPPVLEATQKFGKIKVCKYAPAHSDELAEYLIEEFRGQEERIKSQAAVVLGPYHGVFSLGKNLDAAFDALERVDINAEVILNSRLLLAEEGAIGEDLSREVTKDIERYKSHSY